MPTGGSTTLTTQCSTIACGSAQTGCSKAHMHFLLFRNKIDLQNKYCYRQAELGIGDCGGLSVSHVLTTQTCCTKTYVDRPFVIQRAVLPWVTRSQSSAATAPTWTCCPCHDTANRKMRHPPQAVAALSRLHSTGFDTNEAMLPHLLLQAVALAWLCLLYVE